MDRPEYVPTDGFYWESYSIDLWAYIYIMPDIIMSPGEGDLDTLAERELALHETGPDQIRIPIVSISSHFALNSIPTATVTAAIGRNVATNAPANIHRVIDLLTSQKVPTPIKVMALINNLGGESPTSDEKPVAVFPKKPFTVFSGYVVGYSADTTTNSNRIVLQCAHWLVDLAFSSAVSRTSVPSNPAAISFNASGFSSEKTVAENKYYSSMMPADVITTEAATKDLWGEGIARYLASLAEQDRFGLSINNFISPVLSNKNYEALRALKLFEDGGITGKKYKYGVPAAINLSGASQYGLDTVAQNIIRQLVSVSTPIEMATSSMWDKMVVDYAAKIYLGIVPMVQRALLVPLLPTSYEYYTYLAAYEIQAISSQISMVRPIRGIAIQTTSASTAGGQGPGLSNPANNGTNSFDTAFVGGYYENPDFMGGQILVKPAPAWLSNIELSPETGVKTVPVKGQTVGTVGAVGEGDKVKDEQKKPTTTAYIKTVADDIAKMMYSFERLANRQLIVKCGLRFDIAPGTSLMVEIPQDKFLQDALCKKRESKWMIGTVNRVSFIIDAEQSQASTSFNLSYVRDEDENESLGTEEHPIYKDYYNGGPLVSWIKP